MCSDGDYDAYGFRGQPQYLAASTSRPMARKPSLPWRKQQYRKLGQMFLQWAETDGGRG